MKRLAIAAGFVVLGSAGAMAAECFDIGIIPDSAASYAPGTDLSVDAGTLSAPGCQITNVLDVGAPGRFVVYRLDSNFDKDGSATYTVTGPDGVEVYDIPASFNDLEPLTRYYAAGENPGSGFSADFDLDYIDGDFFDVQSIDLTVGWTTLADQEDSLDAVGRQQLGLVTHLGGMNDLLTGYGRSLEGENEFTLLGGIGSYQVGATARYNISEGFSVLGGASIIGLNSGDASANGFSGAGALRYVAPEASEFRLFAEGGAQLTAATVSFTRNYDNQTTNGYDAVGSGNGVLAGAYLRGGALWQPDADNEVVFSASLGQSALGISDYVEADELSTPNFFAADLSGSTSYTTVKGGVDWTTKLAPEVDLTASAAVGAAFGSGANAEVFGVGEVNGAPQSTIFAQYGLRLGWELSPGSTLDGFVQGTTGTGIGTHAQIGAAYRMSF
jgi:hypothetical protein